ncbi:MAG: 2OG-Fe dioxygenase family protein [Rubrivivax sp.]|nr:2OG-Fe dioxygenase family protein [Rubrivivax sp.]
MNQSPPLCSAEALGQALAADGFAVVSASTLAQMAAVAAEQLQALAPAWNHLAPDAYLRDGGRYRKRRHGSFVVEAGEARPVPHRAHWQPLDYNALHGGIERWFEPLPPEWSGDAALVSLLRACAQAADGLHPGVARWFVEAHAFRIDCTDGIGRPTPEGAHRDGVDLVAVVLVGRHAIRGGETRVFAADGPAGVRFTLDEPFSALFLDDARVIHESTPIQPLVAGQPGWRDTLVITCRRGGFQDPPTASAVSLPRQPPAPAHA